MAATPRPAPTSTVVSTSPAPAPAPVSPAPASPRPPAPRRRRPARRISAAIFWAVVGALAALLALNLAGYGPALVKHESVRVILPPQRQAQVVGQQQAGQGATTTFSKPQVVAPAPATPSKAKVEVDVNINVNVHQSLSPQPVPLCPRVGHYVLSHEPTTDSRQYDDRGNWIPGHMELVRECRNGALNEFSRWAGHNLPG